MTTDFDSFVEYFFARLADDNFNLNQSLTDYFKIAADKRKGDEANIVDSKITSVLIAALSYDSGESQYNVPHGGGKRTDFTVRISDYPRPVLSPSLKILP